MILNGAYVHIRAHGCALLCAGLALEPCTAPDSGCFVFFPTLHLFLACMCLSAGSLSWGYLRLGIRLGQAVRAGAGGNAAMWTVPVSVSS